jgi:predicted small lipoprotein YifL
MSAMKTVTLLALAALVPTLAACESDGPFDPVHCDYEQAQTTQATVQPADRTEWVDYDGDGIVVVCMWTGAVG